jgi:hypothetical protein
MYAASTADSEAVFLVRCCCRAINEAVLGNEMFWKEQAMHATVDAYIDRGGGGNTH